MSIVAVCPHCESSYTLQPELAGKAIRCPNAECRKVFTVRAAEKPKPAAPARPPAAAKPPAPKPPAAPARPPARPGQTTGAVKDMLPVVEADTPPPPPPPRPKPAAPPPAPLKPAVAAEAKPVPRPKPKPVEAAPVAPPAMEVVWSADADLPGGPPLPPAAVAEPAHHDATDDHEPYVPRRKKKKKGKAKYLVMLLVVGAGIGGAVWFAVSQLGEQDKANEDVLAARAEEEYGKKDYDAAGKTYDDLAQKFPNSGHAAKYKFFGEMSGLQNTSRALGNRENPGPAADKLAKFVEANKMSNYVKPPSTAGADLLDIGKRIGGDAVARAKERTEKKDYPEADKALAVGRGVVEALKPFGDTSTPAIAQLNGDLAAAGDDLKKQISRRDLLAKVATMLQTPYESVISVAEGQFAAAGLMEDPEAQEMIRGAKAKLVSLVKFEPDPADPESPPPPAAASLLFVSPVGNTKTGEKTPGGPSVYLATAHNVLYALDDDTGNMLWAVRIGPNILDVPTVAAVGPRGGKGVAHALVVANVAGRPVLTAHDLRTGKPAWSQPLYARERTRFAPAAGPAVVVGPRVYVPLGESLVKAKDGDVPDPSGTVLVFDLATGKRVGRVVFGDAVGPIVARPGTDLLYVPAEKTRVYVLNVGGEDLDRQPLAPRCVQALTTGHGFGTLRTPLFLGQPGDGKGDRWLVFAQTDGTKGSKLRAFPVPPLPAGEGGSVTEVVAAEVTPALAPLPGWVKFTPTTNGEWLAAVTDGGQVRVYGINQPGSSDRALFPLPAPDLPPLAGQQPVPGLAVPSPDGAVCVLVNGGLRRYKVTLKPDSGLHSIADGETARIGIPMQPAQLNAGRDSACFVVQSPNSTAMRAVVVDLRTGAVRWRRQLGVVLAGAAIPSAEGVLLADQDGGVVVIPAAGTDVKPGTPFPAPADWGRPAPDDPTGPTLAAASADGAVAYTVTPVSPAHLTIRRYDAGKVVRSTTVPSPGAIAGQPAVVGTRLLLPAADGTIYRLEVGTAGPESDSLGAGPPWRADRRDPDAVCFISPISDSAFFTTDGSRKVSKQDWPAGPKFTPVTLSWTLPERVALPPLYLPPLAEGAPARLLAADVSGSVWTYSAADAGAYLKRWRAGTSVIPQGAPSARFALQTDMNGRQLVVYGTDKKYAVGIDPDQDAPLWAKPTDDAAGADLAGPPQPAGPGAWLVTDIAGRVVVFDAKTGERRGSRAIGLPGGIPAAAAVKADDTRVVCPLSDGSAAVVPLPTGK